MEGFAAIAREVIALVSDRDGQRHVRESAAAYGVGMTWPAVGRRYESFARARTEHARRRRSIPRANARRETGWSPEITLKHVQAMTDDTGMLQHAIFSIPRTTMATAWTTTRAPCCSWPSSKTRR